MNCLKCVTDTSDMACDLANSLASLSINSPSPSVWNSIDEDIKLSSLSLFKKKVKQQFIKDY